MPRLIVSWVSNIDIAPDLEAGTPSIRPLSDAGGGLRSQPPQDLFILGPA